jgi:hypothetical protein
LEIETKPIFGALGTDPRCSVAEDFRFLPKSNCVTVSVQLAGIGLQFNTGCGREENIRHHRHAAFARFSGCPMGKDLGRRYGATHKWFSTFRY